MNTNVTRSQPFNTGSSGGGGVAPAPAVPTVNPETDYLQEGGYLATVSALDRALQDFQAQDTTTRGNYDTDYKAGLRDLGYQDDNLDDNTPGNWNWNDVLTASGRGYQGVVNDFASRGMLESQGYFDGLKNLERSLNDQVGAMGTSRQGFKKDQDLAMTNFQNQQKSATDAARIAAIERLSNSLSLG